MQISENYVNYILENADENIEDYIQETEKTSEEVSSNDISGNNSGNVTIVVPDNTESVSILNQINDSLTSLVVDSTPELSVNSVNSSSGIDGYYVTIGSDSVYIPYDRIDDFGVTDSGQLINLSSSTINCYALDSSGNKGSSYRFQSFGTAQKYVQNGSGSYSYTWSDVEALADNSNLTVRGTGISNFDSYCLFFLLIFVALIFFFKRTNK